MTPCEQQITVMGRSMTEILVEMQLLMQQGARVQISLSQSGEFRIGPVTVIDVNPELGVIRYDHWQPSPWVRLRDLPIQSISAWVFVDEHEQTGSAIPTSNRGRPVANSAKSRATYDACGLLGEAGERQEDHLTELRPHRVAAFSHGAQLRTGQSRVT